MKMNPEQGTRSGFTRLDLNYRAASGCRGMGDAVQLAFS